MRILVLGGHGYLGGRIAQYLNLFGFHVTLGSRNPYVKDSFLSSINSIKIDWHDIDDAIFDFDAIIHAAGLNRDECIADPESALDFAKSTEYLLNILVKKSIKRFIYVSTAHVYKAPLEGHITEETPLTSEHPYAKMHQKSESFVRKFSKEGLIEGVVMRLSNVIGPPLIKETNCWQLLINDICKQAICLEKITLHTDGSQERNFLTMQDLNRAVVHLLEIPYLKLEDSIFNVGSEENSTVLNISKLVAERASKILNKKVDVSINQTNKNTELNSLIFNIQKLKNTGFHLKGKLIDEIDQTLMFCMKNF
jgi:UDP-glucose 4-epimerase